MLHPIISLNNQLIEIHNTFLNKNKKFICFLEFTIINFKLITLTEVYFQSRFRDINSILSKYIPRFIIWDFINL